MSDDRRPLWVLDGALDRKSTLADALSSSFEVRFLSPHDLSRQLAQASQDGDELQDRLILADSAGLRGLERALTEADSAMVLNSLGEGVCLCDADGAVLWSNRRYLALPADLRERVERACRDSVRYFREHAGDPEENVRKFGFQVGEDQYFEMIASPVLTPDGRPEDPMRVVAIAWDASRHHRLQRKLDAIDSAGSELVRIESEAIASLNNAQRLALLEDKIIRYTRDLMHFDHFNIYLLEKESNRLLPVMNVGMPPEVADYRLFAETTGSGISGYVAATGKSYICSDVRNDPRYLPGLEHASASLSVPLRLHDQVIGVFNIESRKAGGFTEEDRQFAEIFGRYIALALNILDLLVVERCTTSGTVAVNVIGEINQPLNDISTEAESLRELVLNHPEAVRRLDHIIGLVGTVRRSVQEVARGPKSILGVQEAMEKSEVDPLLLDRHVLVADDEPNIRDTIHTVLTKRGARVTVCVNGGEAIERLGRSRPGEFELILSDISMPDRNGYEVFAAARRTDANVPVILMTGFGYDPHHSIVRASQEGLQCVLFKPFQVDQLLEEVSKALSASVGAK